MAKADLKKVFKELYGASAKEVAMVKVPEFVYLMVDGKGDPNGSAEFEGAVQALYGVAYELKFALKKDNPEFDYVVMPLEGLWWSEGEGFAMEDKTKWLWTAMIMQPGRVSAERVAEMAETVAVKKGVAKARELRMETLEEGLSAQIMHVGPYAEEGPTIQKLHEWIAENGYAIGGHHHEIHMSDMRRVAPEKMKTIIRYPVRQAQ